MRLNKTIKITQSAILGDSAKLIEGSVGEKRSNELLKTIVSKLGTSLNVPEEEVIKQDSFPEG